jgi:hypothetical protein
VCLNVLCHSTYLLTYNFRVWLGTRPEDCSGFIFSKCELDSSGILSTFGTTVPGINPSQILQCERHEKSFTNFPRPCMDKMCLSACVSVGWSVGGSVSLSVRRSVSLLVCWSVGLLVCWSVGLSVCWSVGLSVCQSVGL